MTGSEIIKILGGWEGYRVGTVGPVRTGKGKGQQAVWIELLPEEGPGRCSHCGTLCERIHDVTERWVRELAVFGQECHLLVHRRRVWCEQCGGPKVEWLSWLDPWARQTTRFAQSVARLCQVATVKHVAQAFSIDRKTVKTIDKRYLEKALGPPDLSRVCVLAMDEFAIAKGQRYATLFVDAQRKEVLWVCRGHRRADIRLFFEALGAEGRRRLQAVVMDMNGAYEREVRMQCPHAEIVFDHYHIIAKYNHEVINQVRLQELARLSEKERKRTIVKGTRWLLLRNPNNLTRASDRVRLKELLAVNRPLSIVHILRDDLNFLWTYTDPETALASAQQWCRRAIRSRIGPLKRFVQRLRPYLNGIVAHCRYPFHTSLLEGINNKIKVLKRMAYGFQDEAYFFLKTRQAFPGIGT